ncbi:alkane 1-monooxygenase [Glaciecola sp. XM2]|jgi:alkane 1-monooxygenase|uniref:alkane 1-monooxygenase n=1 Tax=Glaciecola sp. XM2 TaxID=1914931 RepID=UPI001BDEA831|nr:alkane 1-monooxygenase [Glaciecola sp. XM2]MBT1449733.1 alkane 1-monooxygenase [Glaciecola sp. XM2]
MFHYLKFFHYFLTIIIGCVCLLFAGHFIWLGFLTFVGIYVLGDAFLGDDLTTPTLKHTKILDLLLYSALPVSILIFTICMWLVTPFEWYGIAQLSSLVGYDFIAAKEATTWWQLVIAVLFCGFLLSGAGTVVGHELVHRLYSKTAVTTGRWLMSMSFDANFSIEHVFNHHAKVATADDPVTAPRGRHVYSHIVRAIIGTNQSAWAIEKKRLSRKNLPIISIHNQYLRGWLMSVMWMLIAVAIASWQGLIFFIAIGIAAKVILEIVNYMEHYGLVRDPKQRVEPKHSWNSNRKISCWAMFNLPRHSHHHAQGAVPFNKLQPMEDAPVMISGYISTIAVVLIPPLWFKLMQPKLEHWDAHFANEQELEILRQQAQNQPRNIIQALIY